MLSRKELNLFLTEYENAPIYVNAGFNRFKIQSAINHIDHIVLYLSEDAYNPIEKSIEPDACAWLSLIIAV